MDRLSDDTVITIFKYLKPRELESVASASRALSERDAVWHELARELVGTRGGGGRPSGRSSARLPRRLRRSGWRLCKLKKTRRRLRRDVCWKKKRRRRDSRR